MRCTSQKSFCSSNHSFLFLSSFSIIIIAQELRIVNKKEHRFLYALKLILNFRLCNRENLQLLLEFFQISLGQS
nr:MAG TPA: hypothetical protein [Caudoviricetes sp.]